MCSLYWKPFIDSLLKKEANPQFSGGEICIEKTILHELTCVTIIGIPDANPHFAHKKHLIFL